MMFSWRSLWTGAETSPSILPRLSSQSSIRSSRVQWSIPSVPCRDTQLLSWQAPGFASNLTEYELDVGRKRSRCSVRGGVDTGSPGTEVPQLSQTALGRGSLLGSRIICVLASLKFRRSTFGYVYQICELMA